MTDSPMDGMTGEEKVAAQQALAGRDLTVNRFRSARGKRLRAKIEALRDGLGRDIRVLDVGGRDAYWENVGTGGIEKVTLLNIDPVELEVAPSSPLFVKELGDACNMPQYADDSFDLLHSNSVIEHVGPWPAMSAMAKEMMRVGKTGWVQTPAFEFPIEPHFRMPVVHWFPRAIQKTLLRLRPNYRKTPMPDLRTAVDAINLLTYGEVKVLFPDHDIWVERLALLPKSYVVHW